MEKQTEVMPFGETDIQARILTVRGGQVMLDRDLAELYGVDVKRLNEQVKRNAERFPSDFMFQLSKEECLRSQIATLNEARGKHLKYMPYAFTESGVAMLSGVLRSLTAVEVNIRIMRAFVTMRHALAPLAPVMARLEANERRQLADQSRNEARFAEIFARMSGGELPEHQIFSQGKFWDAKSLLIKFIRRAKSELVIVDAYLGVATLDMLAKRQRAVKIEIFSPSNGELAETDFEAFGRQYGNLTKSTCGICHDRFIVVDRTELYLIGASLKDAGRLTFAVSKMGASLIPGLLDSLRRATRAQTTYGVKSADGGNKKAHGQ